MQSWPDSAFMLARFDSTTSVSRAVFVEVDLAAVPGNRAQLRDGDVLHACDEVEVQRQRRRKRRTLFVAALVTCHADQGGAAQFEFFRDGKMVHVIHLDLVEPSAQGGVDGVGEVQRERRGWLR